MPPSKAQGVSILRPLKGLDLELYANLRSSFVQNYPKFEIIFSVASPNDPAIEVVKQLISEYPKVDARLIIGKREWERKYPFCTSILTKIYITR
jgi:ceramide glucosyltransferase